jgi:hypothetical protein
MDMAYKIQNTQEDTGWAELFLPIQSINTDSIQIQTPKYSHANRPLSEFQYSTDDFSLTNLPILTTFLKVHSWDSSTGRLELETDAITASKIITIQKRILTIVSSHPSWASRHTTVQQDFQYMYHNGIFTVYLHGANPDQAHTGRVWIWSASQWKKGVGATTLRKGQQIRLAIRFQGICTIQAEGSRIRYRIQHQTVAIYKQT